MAKEYNYDGRLRLTQKNNGHDHSTKKGFKGFIFAYK
jgi:hypothetical protein